MLLKNFEITKVSIAAHETYSLEFFSPEIASIAVPGQFVNIKIDESCFPLLRRPMSICDVEGERVKILFNVVGRGTAMLAQKQVGDKLDVLGPLGHGFNLDGGYELAVLVGGGLGVAPFPFLTRELAKREVRISSFVGTRTASHLVRQGLRNVSVATDDGSEGLHGTVVELLNLKLDEFKTIKSKMFACGPAPMLRTLHRVALRAGISCEASLETAMACGVGICQGCPIEMVDADRKYKLACKDGPVFDISRIVI